MHKQDTLQKILEFIARNKDGVIVIYGPTASGKSSLSVWIVDQLLEQQKNAAIISADSRQIYRHMDIGTDKISLSERTRIQHYGIDLVNPDERYTAYQRQQSTKSWIQDIQSSQGIPFVVGGTGLYIDTIYKNFSLSPDVDPNRKRRQELQTQESQDPWSLWIYLQQVDPTSAKKLHPNNIRYIIRALEIYEQTWLAKSDLVTTHDPDWPLLMIHLNPSPALSDKKIRTRVEEMLEEGLIEEVQKLSAKWYTSQHQAMNGIGYKQTLEWLENWTNSHQDLIESIVLATTRYAKRQRSRFRRYTHDALHAPRPRVEYIEYPIH